MSDEIVDYRGHPVPPADRAQLLRDRLEQEYPPPWKPAVGETITGVFARLEHGYAQYAGECTIMVLADPVSHVETSVWLMHLALIEKMKKENPAIGELVAIKYLGISQASNAAMYRVTVDRERGTAIDWNTAGSGRLSAGAGAAAEADEPAPCPICKWTNAHQPSCPNDPSGGADDIPF